MTKVKNKNSSAENSSLKLKQKDEKLRKTNLSGHSSVSNSDMSGRRTSPRKRMDCSKQTSITDFIGGSRGAVRQRCGLQPAEPSLSESSTTRVSRTSSPTKSGNKSVVKDDKNTKTVSLIGSAVNDSPQRAESALKTAPGEEQTRRNVRKYSEGNFCGKNTNSSNNSSGPSKRSPRNNNTKRTNPRPVSSATSDLSLDDQYLGTSMQSKRNTVDKSKTKMTRNDRSDKLPAAASSSEVLQKRSKLKINMDKQVENSLISGDGEADCDDEDEKLNSHSDASFGSASCGLVTPRPSLRSFSEISPSWDFNKRASLQTQSSRSSSQVTSSQETIPYRREFSSQRPGVLSGDKKVSLGEVSDKSGPFEGFSYGPAKLSRRNTELSARSSECSGDTMSVDSNYRGSDCDDDDYSEKGGRMSRSLASKNIEFYTNKRISEPKGDLIENMLETWRGCYNKLEEHHGYIQWLFPINENGMNCHAQQLQPHEAEFIKNDRECRKRFVRAYQLMLDFYGLELNDLENGNITAAQNFRERFRNLNVSFHNNLRITRIIKCLGMLGFEHYQAPLVEFLIESAFRLNGLLTNCRRSCVQYWLPAVLDEQERQKLELMPQLSEYKLGLDKAATRRSFVNSYQ